MICSGWQWLSEVLRALPRSPSGEELKLRSTLIPESQFPLLLNCSIIWERERSQPPHCSYFYLPFWTQIHPTLRAGKDLGDQLTSPIYDSLSLPHILQVTHSPPHSATFLNTPIPASESAAVMACPLMYLNRLIAKQKMAPFYNWKLKNIWLKVPWGVMDECPNEFTSLHSHLLPWEIV